MDKNKIKRLVREIIGTSSGGEYNTPKAFNNSPKKANIYYYKLGYKPVNRKQLNSKAKGIEVKKLWEEEGFNLDKYIDELNINDESLKNHIRKRISGFDQLEYKLNNIIPLLRNAKNETIDYYRTTPSYDVLYGTDITNEYLDDIIKLFKQENEQENKQENEQLQ
jgi:hypothetical protein